MKIKLQIVLGVSFLICSSLASAKFSGKAAFTTNYIWRGVSQTQNMPAVQGELAYDILDSGFYVSVFGSNVNFGEEPDPETLEMPEIARSEFDYAAGYSHEFNDDWSMDIGFMTYTYPDASLNNYGEGYGSVTYKILTADFSYTGNNFNTGTNGYYAGLGIKYELFKDTKYVLLKDLYAGGHIGYFVQDKDVDGGSYADYMLSLTKTIQGVNFALSVTDTSGRGSKDKYSSSKVFFTVSKEF